jgi:hypothetical protein
MFRISTHARDELTLSMILEKGYNFDFSYFINHLSFGKDIDIRLIKRRFGDKITLEHPLDGLKIEADPPKEGESNREKILGHNVLSTFKLTAVPATF